MSRKRTGFQRGGMSSEVNMAVESFNGFRDWGAETRGPCVSGPNSRLFGSDREARKHKPPLLSGDFNVYFDDRLPSVVLYAFQPANGLNLCCQCIMNAHHGGRPHGRPTTDSEILIKNLRLLDLDEEFDWPHIRADTFAGAGSAVTTSEGQRAGYWALYKLLEAWDPQTTRKVGAMRPQFAPGDIG